MMICRTTIWLVASLAVLIVNSSWAQDDRQRQSELGARQRVVERKMAELEEQFTSMAAKLQLQEPERAQRLVDAYQQAKESLITRKMAEVGELLDLGKWDQAEETLDLVISRLEELVRMLLKNQPQKQTKEEQIAQFEHWKSQIEQMRREQQAHSRETDKVADKESELEKLDAQIKQLNDLIARQQSLMTETGTTQGLRALDKIADKQFDLRKDTEELSRQLAGPESSSDSGSSPQTDDGPAVTTDNHSSSQTAGEPTEQGNHPDSDHDVDSTRSETTRPPEDAESGQPTGSQSDSSSSSPSTSGGAKSQPGEQPLQQASRAQERAEEDLASGRTDDAQQQQEQALTEMERARTELNKERRRLASLPPDANEQMAREQRRIKDMALDVVEQMAESPSDDGSHDQQNNQPQGQQPGQQSVQDAADAMGQAAQDLQNQQSDDAQQKQQRAEQKLDEALEEIEERLNQLRDETREEKLQRLEGRFTEMLQRQQSVSAVTIEMDDKKINLGPLQRREQLVVLRLAIEETEIGELGRQAYDLLLEDGTSSVLPELVQELIVSLAGVAQQLHEEQTGQLTQLLQQEIESALLDLLQSLEEAQDEGEPSSGGGGGGEQPLLKRSAELKMLRAAQHRLHRKTQQLDNIKQVQPTNDKLDQEIHGLAEKQAKLQQMAEQLMDKDE